MRVTFLCALLAIFLLSCGGDSGTGSREDIPPTAVAAVFGANITTAGDVRVRSNTDVLLSGQNSSGGDGPLIEFEWRQINVADYEVEMYERSSNSRVFRAPKIPIDNTDGVTLEFELTVTDAEGVQASDRVNVTVTPALDADHFLSRPLNDEDYIIVVGPDTGATLTNDVPITLVISRTAIWTDRQNRQQQQFLGSKTLSGTVSASAPADLSDTGGLYFVERIPLLNIDEVNAFYQAENRDQRLEFERVTSAELRIDISMQQQAAGDITLQLASRGAGSNNLNLLDMSGASQSFNRLSFTKVWLQQQTGMESRTSGENYYRCIDPANEAVTLSSWLSQAGFTEDADDVIHATYLNNYDLNFGRDMFLRQDDNGNVYSYVVNSPTLENALSGRNDFATVVMEFSPAPTGQCGDGTFEPDVGGKKIVKFYSYVPDETTGEYVRAPTMNFDGRGERALPGVCIACHFGDYNSEDFNVADFTSIPAESANLNSSFMIWDLDAFLYTQNENETLTDPIYAANAISDEVTRAYSRNAQEDAFRALNQAVLHTFTYDTADIKRYETPIKLLHGLYGNSDAIENLNFGSNETPLNESDLAALQAQIDTLPSNDFDGENYIQPGWADEPELYHRVYARNCRLCHAQIGETSIDFDSYQEFVENERLVNYVFEQGLMPLSRLTMDRFWSDFYNDTSAAEYLRQHLNSDNNPDNDVSPDLRPGAPVAVVTPSANSATQADVVIDFDDSQLFDATQSLFSDSYRWRLNDAFQTSDNKFTYRASTPGESAEISVQAINTEDFISSATVTRTILVRNNVPTISAVPTQTVNEGDTLTIDLYSALCPAGNADSLACRSVFGDIRQGASPQINIVGTPINASIEGIDSINGVVTVESNASADDGDAVFDFTLTDNFGETSASAQVRITVNALDGPAIGSPDTCTIDAKSFVNDNTYPISFGSIECPDPSANDTTSAGLSLSLVSINSAGLRTGSSVELSGNTILFEPARFFVGQESFTYTVQDSSLSQRTNTGTVLVDIQATQSFADLTSTSGPFGTSGTTGCADCHDGSLSTAPNWFNAENVRLAATNDTTMPYGSPEIALAEPTTTQDLLGSILFRNGCDGVSGHTGGNRLCNAPGAPSSVSDLNDFGRAILTWLEEGASE